MRITKWLPLGLALAVIAPGFVAPSFIAIASAYASEIRVGYTQDALTLDPANPGNRDTETIIRNMYDGLLTRDAAMRVVPELADSWRRVDPVTYEFHLRDGVRFHDGALLTAEDVKFTMERVRQDRWPNQPAQGPARAARPRRHRRSAHGTFRAEQALAAAAGDAAVPRNRQRGVRQAGRR